MTVFIIAWEYTGIQPVLFDIHEWGHKFINQSNKHIFINDVDITVVVGHRGSDDIGNFWRIEFNLFSFKKVLYFVFPSPTVVSVMVGTLGMLCARALG